MDKYERLEVIDGFVLVGMMVCITGILITLTAGGIFGLPFVLTGLGINVFCRKAMKAYNEEYHIGSTTVSFRTVWLQ